MAIQIKDDTMTLEIDDRVVGTALFIGRESIEWWADLLRDCARRGMRPCPGGRGQGTGLLGRPARGVPETKEGPQIDSVGGPTLRSDASSYRQAVDSVARRRNTNVAPAPCQGPWASARAGSVSRSRG